MENEVYYYAERNNGQISHTFRAGELKNDSPAYFQRLINDIDNGRYDHKLTPGVSLLKTYRNSIKSFPPTLIVRRSSFHKKSCFS